MLRYIILVSLCWAVFYLLYHFWLRRETFFAANRWYLLGSLLLGLCIPLLQLPQIDSPATAPLSIVYQTPVVISGEWLEVTVRPETEVKSGPTLWQVLRWVYLLGVAIATLRFCYGLGQIYQLYREAEIIARPGYKLVRTNRSHLPFSFFHLLFQSREMQFAIEEEEQIYRHEEAHINGRHSIDVILIELVGIALWCSPLLYLYRRSLRDVHEYLADAAVLQTTRRKQYSKLLLRQFQSGLQLALANHFIRSQFKNRINMMTRQRSRNGALLKYLLVLPALILAVFLFARRADLAGDLNWNAETAAKVTVSVKDTIPKTAEVMPRYPGCEELATEAERNACAQKEFLMYIYKSIKYPAEARKAGIQGTVIVNFTIDQNGQVQNPEILKTPGGGLGEEVLRLINDMPRWKPGLDKGQAVAVQMTLPVKFALEGEKKEAQATSADPYDVMPVFAGCEGLNDLQETQFCTQEKLSQFMAEHLKYPAEAKELGIEGKVFVQLTIGETGKVEAAEVTRSVDDRLDAEALRVARSLPDWQPAQKEGKPVKAVLTLPILFDLPIEHQAVVIGYMIQEADRTPRFPGCEGEADEQVKTECAQKAFLSYIFNNIRYPQAAKENKVEGMVVASFEVDEAGAIGKVKILRSLGYGTDEEVERVLLGMNELPERWTPARKDGKIVKAQMTLPVKFALPKEEQTRELSALTLQDFNLSPNPNDGRFQLRFQAEPLPTYIRITDAAGKIVLEENLPNFDGNYRNDLNLGQKSQGAYFLAIVQEGKGKFTHTFIVQ